MYVPLSFRVITCCECKITSMPVKVQDYWSGESKVLFDSHRLHSKERESSNINGSRSFSMCPWYYFDTVFQMVPETGQPFHTGFSEAIFLFDVSKCVKWYVFIGQTELIFPAIHYRNTVWSAHL